MPPMSTISAPSSTTCATRSKALSSAQVAPLVVEGVRGPVDDRHHQRGVVGELAVAELEGHRALPRCCAAGGRSRTGTARVRAAAGAGLVLAQRDLVRVVRGRCAAARAAMICVAIAPRSRSAWCRCARRPRSTWATASMPSGRTVSTRAASSTAYPVGTGSVREVLAAHRPLARQRLHEPGQLGEVQRDQRPRDELGHPAALERALGAARRRRAAAARRTP